MTVCIEWWGTSLVINTLDEAWAATQTERVPQWVKVCGGGYRAEQRVNEPFGYVECQCTLTIQRDFQLSQRDESAPICILPYYLACQCSMSLLCSTIVT